MANHEIHHSPQPSEAFSGGGRQLPLGESVTAEAKAPLADCANCTLAPEPFVPSSGQGSIACVGIAPSTEEVKQGQPFVGPSGKLLRMVLDEHNIDQSNVLFTNVVLCKTPGNRDPSKAEIKCCSERLRSELAGTKQIVPLGKIAASAIMGGASAITRLRVGPPKTSKFYPDAEVIPTFHPAACLRSADSFPSLVKDIGKLNGSVKLGWEPPRYTVIDRSDHALRAIQELTPYKQRLTFDIETAYDKDSAYEHPSQYELLCIGVGFAPGRVVVFGRNCLREKSVQRAMGILLDSAALAAHNGKFDLQGVRRFANGARLAYDTMLASYADDERGGVHGLKYLAVETLGAPQYDDGLKKYKSFADVPDDELHLYNACDVHATWLLQDHYEATLDADGKRLNSFLTRASNALVNMELEGIAIDTDYLSRLTSEFEESLEEIEVKLSRWVKNPRSPMQIMSMLREQYEIVTETTDVAFLQWAAQQYAHDGVGEFCRLMLEYRAQHKLFSTYVKGASRRLHNGRLYPTILLHGTVTGRPSSRNPNLFNIPRGSAIRRLFVPAEGNVFIQADYSQIELRVVACLASDPYLRQVFSDPTRDIHSEVGERLGIPRQNAKTIVYGLSYGMEAPHLSNLLGIPLRTANRYMKEFFSVIPHVAHWKNELRNQILKENRDLETPYGRRRRLWLITDENKKDIVKEGTAFIPQSIASDICLTALVRLLERGFKCRLSVYDSIMVECAPSDVEAVSAEMNKEMEQAGREFSEFVPFVTETKVGKSWGDL